MILNLNKLVQELTELNKKREILMKQIEEMASVSNVKRCNCGKDVCKNCVYKDCFDCRVHYYQEDMLEKFAHEGWDIGLILQYDNRKDMAKASGKCKFYCEDASKIVTCTECKHCILGEQGTMSAMTGECLKERCGTYDEYSYCPYGERK